MIGLQFRDNLKGPVLDELEQLAIGIRNAINELESGLTTVTGAVAATHFEDTFTGGDTSFGHIEYLDAGAFFFGTNVRYDPVTGQYFLDNTAASATGIMMQNGIITFLNFAAGANPVTPTTILDSGNSGGGVGQTVLYGALTVTGLASVNAGLKFPATQTAVADPNTLDDYEEGTWTPVLGGTGGTSGQTYTTQTGTYTKVGNKVTLTFDIILSAKGTITGNVQISGLPFVAGAGNGIAVTSFRYGVLATNWVNVIGLLVATTSVMLVRGAAAAATNNDTSLVTADINNTTFISGAITYRT